MIFVFVISYIISAPDRQYAVAYTLSAFDIPRAIGAAKSFVILQITYKTPV